MQEGDADLVLAAAGLFDAPPQQELVADFLHRPGHHLHLAFDEAGAAVGFVSAVEIVHPDKPVELLVYELGVDEGYRRRGVATALLRSLEALANASGMRGLWVVTEPDNAAALVTYRRFGADEERTVTFTWAPASAPRP